MTKSRATKTVMVSVAFPQNYSRLKSGKLLQNRCKYFAWTKFIFNLNHTVKFEPEFVQAKDFPNSNLTSN